MNKYRVYVSRKNIHATTIAVEAKNEEEAEARALEIMGNYDMRITAIDPDGDYAKVQHQIEEGKPNPIDVVIEVQGGVVTALYASEKLNVSVGILDRDIEQCGSEDDLQNKKEVEEETKRLFHLW